MIYAIPNEIYTFEEYLELDFLTDAKYEFFDGKLVEISLESLDCELSVDEIYQGVDFEE